MKFFKVLFLFLLFGGDHGLELASLEAFPVQAVGCDGRANVLFAPICPFLLCCPHFIGGTALLTVVIFLSILVVNSWQTWESQYRSSSSTCGLEGKRLTFLLPSAYYGVLINQ